MTTVRSNIEIARDAKMKPIAEIGRKIDIPRRCAAPLRAVQGQALHRLHRQR